MESAPSSGRMGQNRSPGGEDARTSDFPAAHLADLMADCAIGSQEAFGELYDLTKRQIYGTVLRVLRSPDHAEEVTQEIYVEVWKQASRYAAQRGSVLGWMVTMAQRRAIDRVRSVSREVARDENYASEIERDRDEVWDSVARQSEVERVRGALAHLTPIQREAIQLAYYDGLTQVQISAALDLPIGTVKTRIRDGMIRLREALRGGSDD